MNFSEDFIVLKFIILRKTVHRGKFHSKFEDAHIFENHRFLNIAILKKKLLNCVDFSDLFFMLSLCLAHRYLNIVKNRGLYGIVLKSPFTYCVRLHVCVCVFVGMSEWVLCVLVYLVIYLFVFLALYFITWFSLA